MENPTQHLSQALKAVRKEKGWSLDKTAAETGVSKAMLGQIERGESNPTIAVLWKIATGTHTSLSTFLEPQTGDSETLYRASHEIRNKPATDDMLVAPIFPFEKRFGFEIYELTLLPGYERVSEPHEPGVTEHIIVIKGNLELLINGKWKKLKPGEAVRFAADKVHGYRNPYKRPVVFHDVIYYP